MWKGVERGEIEGKDKKEMKHRPDKSREATV